jgi:hypothetical protein
LRCSLPSLRAIQEYLQNDLVRRELISMDTPPIARIDVPGDWEIRTQVTYIEPPEVISVPLAVQPTQPKARANIVVSRSPTTVATPAEAMNDFYKQTAPAVPGFKSLGQGTLSFDDGARGCWVTVCFNATPQLRLAQRHIFRIDAGILTQLVATVDELHLPEMDSRMQRIVCSLKP